MSRSSPAVIYDIQATQSRSHGDRGIARYSLELAQALLDRDDVSVTPVLNAKLPVPGAVEPLVARGRLVLGDRADYRKADILHVGSPFELDVPLDHVWPRLARVERLRLVATVYDLIPLVLPERYLSDVRIRRQYTARLELLRRADRLLTISQATARDVQRLLDIPATRVVNVGAGVSDRFQPPDDRQLALAAARAQLPWLRPGFVLYTGGIEPRKNVDGLLRAYASLPRDLRSRHPLVVVCRVDPRLRPGLERRVGELDLDDSVRFAGWVPDRVLLRLYQACELLVFPSLYEGFGLPVAEAIACGAPVLASRSSAMVELVTNADALFDPHDPASIAAALERSLRSPNGRPSAERRGLDDTHRWPAVAERVAEEYRALARRPRRPRPGRKRIAFATPLPPEPTGVATYSHRLLEELARLCDVDVFVDEERIQDAAVPRGASVRPIGQLRACDAAVGGYDRIVYSLGNSPFHAAMLAALRSIPGVVIAHDVRLPSLYEYLSRERPDIEPRSFYDILQGMYSGRVPPTLGLRTYVTLRETARHGIVMAREVIAASQRYLAHSAFAASLARLDARPEDEWKIGTLRFGAAAPPRLPARTLDRPVIATFGWVSPSKRIGKILAALPDVLERHGDLLFAIVGPVKGHVRDRILRRAEELGVTDSVVVAGAVDEETFAWWMANTTVAVQLRTSTNGESSASVAECLAAGIPTVVSAFGPFREIPDSCAVKVAADADARELARAVCDLLDDPERRDTLGRAARRYAAENGFDRAAEDLYRALFDVLPAVSRRQALATAS